MAGYLEISCGIAAIIILLYYYLVSNLNFWKVRGVPGPNPLPIFGTMKDVFLLRTSITTYFTNLYNEYKDEPMIGIFTMVAPGLVIKDPDLIQDILVKDFSKFDDRGVGVHEKTDPLSSNIFNLEPKRWRTLRGKLSPSFTSGKLKGMLLHILECAEHMEEYLCRRVEMGQFINCRDLATKYSIDVIGSCIFGIDMNEFSKQQSDFSRIGTLAFSPNAKRVMTLLTRHFMPTAYGLIGYVCSPPEYADFFKDLTTDVIAYREKNNIFRNDFVNILLELKRNRDKITDVELTDTMLAAQSFAFFTAGFETSALTITHALYELALNPEIQDKLRQEIKEHYAKHGHNLSFENILKISYLDKVCQETLRKYPVVPFLMRKSVCDYTFENTKVSIPKGQKIWIPTYAIHHDPDIYPNPDIFDPERFSSEVAESRHPMQYIPFGKGPRNCIGERFAVYQTKIALMKIIQKFKLETCEETPIPYRNHQTSLLLAPQELTIRLKMTKIE